MPGSTPIPATVKANKLVIYQKPSSGSKVLGTMQKGDTLNVQAISGNWALVEKDGKIGYALKGGLVPTESVTATPTVAPTATATATPAPTASAIPATVSVERLVISEKASTSSARLGTMKQGETLNVQAISGSWARVEKDGRIGYCKKAGLTPTADVTPEPSASATAEPLVEACLSRLGVADCFDFWLSCETVGVGKHRSDVYDAAAARMGTQPGEIAVYEDALYAARTAKAAGYYLVAVYDASAASHWDELCTLADEAIVHW